MERKDMRKDTIYLPKSLNNVLKKLEQVFRKFTKLFIKTWNYLTQRHML